MLRTLLRIGWAFAHPVGLSLLRPTPMWTILYVTRRCNLDCSYCMFKDDSVEDPSLDGLLMAITRIRALGCRFVSVTGGEPTLREDLPEIVAHCRRLGVISYVNSNGTLLTEEYLDRLGRAGLDIINLSIDAVERHDDSKKDIARRGNTLDRLLKARDLFGFLVISNQVLCASNISTSADLVAFLAERRVPIAHGLQYPIGEGFAALDEAAIDGAIDAIQRLRGRSRILTSTGYLEAVRQRLKRQGSWACDAGNSFFVVDIDGRVGICDRHRPLDLNIADVTPQRYPDIAAKGRNATAFERCSTECMVNCAWETSHFRRHRLEYLADQVMGIASR